MANFGPLMAEICRRVKGTPANFNRFWRLGFVTSLNGGQQNFAESLTISWAGTLYVHFRGLLAPNGILPSAKSSKSCVLLYWQRYCTALQQRPSGKLCGISQGMELPNFRRGRHLYSAGRPSRWALAHILVVSDFTRYIMLSLILNVKFQHPLQFT